MADARSLSANSVRLLDVFCVYIYIMFDSMRKCAKMCKESRHNMPSFEEADFFLKNWRPMFAARYQALLWSHWGAVRTPAGDPSIWRPQCLALCHPLKSGFKMAAAAPYSTNSWMIWCSSLQIWQVAAGLVNVPGSTWLNGCRTSCDLHRSAIQRDSSQILKICLRSAYDLLTVDGLTAWFMTKLNMVPLVNIQIAGSYGCLSRQMVWCPSKMVWYFLDHVCCCQCGLDLVKHECHTQSNYIKEYCQKMERPQEIYQVV